MHFWYAKPTVGQTIRQTASSSDSPHKSATTLSDKCTKTEQCVACNVLTDKDKSYRI